MEDKPKATPDEQVNSGVETLKETRKTVVSASTDTLRTANVTERVPSVLDIFDELDEAPQRAANGTGATASKPIPASFLPGEGKAKTGSNKLPPKRPAQVDAHQRKVSWGGFEEAMNSHGNPPARKNVQQPNIQQPFLGDQDGSVSPVSLDEGRVLYSSENRPRGNRKISVDDLVRRSPMEAEAETYIIRALEERDPTRSRADSSGAPPVLSNVTDEAISNFSSNDENTSNATPFDERVPSSRSAGTTSRVAKPTHRRMHTVEQELAGLTSAIDAFHNMEVVVPEDQAPPSPLGRGRINTLDTQGIAGLEIPMSSAEAFHNNASILLHRTKAPTQDDTSGASAGDEEDSQAPSIGSTLTTSASVRWRKLKHVLKAGTSSNTTSSNTKKDDGDVIVEEEIGMEDEEAMEDTISNGRINTENIEPEAFASENINGSNRNLKTTKVTAGYSPFFKEVQDFFGPRRNSIYAYFKIMGTYVFLPTIGVAAILFHLADNPPIGILANGGKPVNGTLMNTDGEVVDPGVASASWWLLFLGVRQLFTFTLSKATELFVIDFLCIRSKFMLRLTGPWFTLLLLQSRGWPILLVFWSLLDFALLSGTKRFFAHWLYWQDVFELFNESNPSGDVVNSDWNHRILAIAASVGAVVCAKRFWMGQYLGRQTFAQYAEKLADVMNKILLVSEVAKLSRDFQKFTEGTPVDALDADELDGLLKYSGDDPSADGRSQRNRSASAEAFSTTGASRVVDPEDVNPLTGQLNSSQKVKIAQLLGAWEEPMVAAKPAAVASIDSILQFRTALSLLKTNYPFSALFGLADTRENCVLSSQEVYERLLLKTPDKDVLSFEILALLGVNKNGSLNNNKLRQLVRLFRPDREGDLDCIDFVKSVDVVYKELRLLRAAVANSSKIDHAFETIINISASLQCFVTTAVNTDLLLTPLLLYMFAVFYIIVTTVILSQLGFDPLALFLSISGVILAFA
jgi:hypothetical protein